MFVVACGLLSASSAAQMTVYLDRAEFLSRLSNPTTYSFDYGDGFPAAPSEISSFGNGAVISTSTGGGPASIGIYAPQVWNQVLTGRAAESAGVPQVDFLVPVALSFTTAVYGVGFDAVATSDSGTAVPVLRVTYADSGASDQVVRDPPGPTFTSDFLGVVSSEPIAGIEFYAAPSGQPNVFGLCAGAIDNLTTAAVVVPEPSYLWAAVLTAFALWRPRRGRHAIMGHARSDS